MTQPAKFKFWDAEKKEWPKRLVFFHDGDRLQYEKRLFVDEYGFVWEHDSQSGCIEILLQIKVVEWTGCFDKNRSPIYDGDVLKIRLDILSTVDEYFIGYVKNLDIFGIGRHKGEFMSFVDAIVDKEIEIIGSSLANPELLDEL